MWWLNVDITGFYAYMWCFQRKLKSDIKGGYLAKKATSRASINV